MNRCSRKIVGWDVHGTMLDGDYHEALPGLRVADLEGYWHTMVPALFGEYFVAFETDVVMRYEVGATEASFKQGVGEVAAILGFTTAGI